MPTVSRQLAGILFGALMAAMAQSRELPDWADSRLPVTDGLVMWLDAAAQPRAYRHFGDAPPEGESPLPRWADGSGHERHLQQRADSARPTWRTYGKIAAVRFDGGDDYLTADDLGVKLNEATLFVVAAPAANPGGFRGLLSLRAAGTDDFTSGLNIDQGFFPSDELSTINVEGAGFGGMQNLRTGSDPLLEFRRIGVSAAVGPQGVALYVDGRRENARPRQPGVLRMDQLIVGARAYGGVDARGFFAGEVAEVILYDRVLSEEERQAVDSYLAVKYEDAPPVDWTERSWPIARVKDPPPVQVHVPGFTVRRLPLELPNVNNVLYRDDGTLVALAYNGDVYHLTDSNGDGLEDRAQLFYQSEGSLRAPIGMALTPPKYERGRGVLVAAKSKCTLLLDTDGDDRADEEVIVADGWTELPHGVDALGAAFDPRDHAVFFGLGVTNFTNAYLVDDAGAAGYRLDGERGAILRVAPDFKSREVFATGIRFPVAIRFNAAGDLFCTDQEGATWLANGNPFDELLHVQRNRHYGFPPRHPRHLPDVIDEPSVYDYRPQHQSTCGLNFNEPATDGTLFGPSWWRDDAIVTGYSRGKLYRTALCSTESGYVAQNQLLATMTMMPTDACIAPGHSLVVAAHSGGPDWGSGPSGTGELFKLIYSDPEAPLPALVWPQGPREVRIAFDRPVDPATLQQLASRIQIEGGEYVAAGDRFESIRPGYASVEHQQTDQRVGVEVLGAQLTADRRTLILTTAHQVAALTYAVALPELNSTSATVGSALPQRPDIDLEYDLSGVEAHWEPADGAASWNGWLPHVDLDVSRRFTDVSAAHRELWSALAAAGSLTLKTTLQLAQMLRPAVQVGSTLDYELPPEVVTLTLQSNCRLEVNVDGAALPCQRGQQGGWSVQFTASAQGDRGVPLTIALQREANDESPTLTIDYHTNEDLRRRALPLHRFSVPWAAHSDKPAPMVDNRDMPELAGGDWLRGRQEFFGQQAGCSKCHRIRGEGGLVGPDLSNLVKRDYASVLRDITQPSFAINPDFVTQVILLEEGRMLSGAVRTEGEDFIVSDQEGEETRLAHGDIAEMSPSELSIMPEGITRELSPERLRDLMTFLLVAPPSMPVYGELAPPPPRKLQDVHAVLADAAPSEAKRALQIELVAGPKDHGPGEHDYPAWQTAWSRLLEMDRQVKVSTANLWPTKQELKSADALVIYQQGSWSPERAADVDRFLRRGGGIVYIHYAVDGGADPQGLADRIGLAWLGGASKFRHGPLDVEFEPGSDHPIARGFERVHFHDESYWNLVGSRQRLALLASGREEGQQQPLFWTREPGQGGRIFVSIPGHFAWTFDDPLFRILLLRGIAWAAGEPVDRFNDLVLPGARVTP